MRPALGTCKLEPFEHRPHVRERRALGAEADRSEPVDDDDGRAAERRGELTGLALDENDGVELGQLGCGPLVLVAVVAENEHGVPPLP